MPQFDDDLFLGTAPTGMGLGLNDPSPMPNGVGPLGRIYVWDTVPAAAAANNIAASQTPTGANTLSLTAGSGVTAVRKNDFLTVYQLDCPRAVSVTQAGAGTQRNFTVSGYDIYDQPMTEVITSTVGATVNGKKAFSQVESVSVSGATTTACTVGTTDVIGIPVRVTNAGYIASVKWDNTLADDAGTFVAAVTTTATTTSGDVRGTYDPSSACDGAKRLVMGILLPAIAVGPNATRIGALGVTQA